MQIGRGNFLFGGSKAKFHEEKLKYKEGGGGEGETRQLQAMQIQKCFEESFQEKPQTNRSDNSTLVYQELPMAITDL